MTTDPSREPSTVMLPRRIGAGLAVVLVPALLLYLLLVEPAAKVQWEIGSEHFYIVTAVALLAFVMTVLLSIGAVAIRQYAVLFLALGFMAMAGFFTIHGLATPGVLLPETDADYAGPTLSVLGVSAFLALATPSLLFALSYTRLMGWLEKRLPFWPAGGLMVALAAGLALFGVLAISQTSAVANLPLTRPPVSFALVAVSVALLLFSAWSQTRAYLAFRLPTQGSLAVAFVLLAEAQVAVVVAPPWSPAWWLYHVLMLGAVTVALRAIWLERTRGQSLRDILEGTLDLQVRAGLELEQVETIAALASAIEAKDRDTRGHTVRVAEVAVAIGREMGLDNPTLRRIAHSGLLHDIGKLNVPDEILTKEGPLTDAEWVIMKQHPGWGLDILDRIGGFRREGGIILAHHERMDGSGYPRALRGEEIPLEARIIAVADTYDVMVSDRPYRKAMPAYRALEILRDEAGAHLDRVAVDALLSLLARGEDPRLRALPPEARAA